LVGRQRSSDREKEEGERRTGFGIKVITMIRRGAIFLIQNEEEKD
jgi:hypothetical protein